MEAVETNEVVVSNPRRPFGRAKIRALSCATSEQPECALNSFLPMLMATKLSTACCLS